MGLGRADRLVLLEPTSIEGTRCASGPTEIVKAAYGPPARSALHLANRGDVWGSETRLIARLMYAYHQG